MDMESEICRAKRLLAILLIASALVGCTSKTPTPVIPAQTPTPTASPVPQTTETSAAGQLASRWAASLPAIDGLIEDLWSQAEALQIPLTWGSGGTERAFSVEMRSLYNDDTIAFLARWPGGRPANVEGTAYNELTLHWRIPEQVAQGLSCTVVCHTVFVDGSGHLLYANAETIPQGGDETLPAAGGWDAGTWTLEWSRPLVDSNPFDLQFDDRTRAFPFRIKIFERVEGRPDPVSDGYELVFQP
jgi:hypothetical protein